MKKRILSLALALMMCLSMMPSALAAEVGMPSDKFTDVPANAWYKSELDYAVLNGYINGTSDTTFSPNSTLTRGQFVTILGRMIDPVEFSFVCSFCLEFKFTDVDWDAYYRPYVIWATAGDVANGTSDTTFSPNSSITVEQMGTMLANYITKRWSKDKPTQTFNVTYKDASSISSWAKDGMDFMRKLNLLVVDANGNVNPKKAVTRAECAVALTRFARQYGYGDFTKVVVAKSTTPEGVAKNVHDTLWASGMLVSSMTQTQKAKVYFDWLYANCEYDWDAYNYWFSHNGNPGPYMDSFKATGALVKGKAVCEGITLGYNMLLATEGIQCSSATIPSHMWSTAVLDGKTTHIDVTNKWFGMTEAEAFERENDPVRFSSNNDSEFEYYKNLTFKF